MKRLLIIPVVLGGCASPPPPPAVTYQNSNPPPVQVVLDAKVQQLSRNEVIQAVNECEGNNLRAVTITSKRMVSGMNSDIIIDVQCYPKFKYPY